MSAPLRVALTTPTERLRMERFLLDEVDEVQHVQHAPVDEGVDMSFDTEVAISDEGVDMSFDNTINNDNTNIG